jgi:hypothetical protein
VLRRHTPSVAGVGDDGPPARHRCAHTALSGPTDGHRPAPALGDTRHCSSVVPSNAHVRLTRRAAGRGCPAVRQRDRYDRGEVGVLYVSPCRLGRRYQVKNAKPDAVPRLHQTEFPWVKTSTVEPMGVEQVGVVEDLATSAVSGSPAAVSSVGSDPFAAAAHDPDQLHRLRVRRRCSRRSSVAATVCCRRTLAPGGDVVLLPPDRAAPPVRFRTLVHCLA